MSYSISARGADKASAKAAIAAEFEAKVLALQPAHAADRDQALAVAGVFIDMLADDPEKDIAVSLNGSLGWTEPGKFHWASVGCSAGYVKRA